MAYDEDEGDEFNEYGRYKDGRDWDADRKEMAEEDERKTQEGEVNEEQDRLKRIEKKIDLLLKRYGYKFE